jgi:hypothetical protein
MGSAAEVLAWTLDSAQKKTNEKFYKLALLSWEQLDRHRAFPGRPERPESGQAADLGIGRVVKNRKLLE